MSGIEDFVNQIHGVVDSANQVATSTGGVKSNGEELAANLENLDSEAAAGQVREALNKLEEGQTLLSQAIEKLNEAAATAQSAKGLTSGGSATTPSATRPATFTRTRVPSARYPYDSWRPLRDEVLTHVCEGDPADQTRGGHLYGIGRPGKTEFPRRWTRDTIAVALISVAADPRSHHKKRRRGRWFAKGTYRGVSITAVVTPDGEVAAGWPESGPGVRKNPPASKPKR